jgi:hypothetical protein
MYNTVRAIVRKGQIELLEQVNLPEGAALLVTLLSSAHDEVEFWQQVSQHSLDAVWDNTEDDIYAALLER